MVAVLDSISRSLATAEVERYHADGVVVLKSVFDAFDMMMWRKAWAPLSQATASSGKVTRKDRFVRGVLPPPLGDIYRSPELAGVARQLLGDDLALYMNRILVKDEQWNGAVAAHQDMPYFHGGTQKLSMFVPLAPFNRTTGGLTFVLGSHRYGNLGVRGTIAVDAYPHLRHLTVEAEPGDVVLMDFLIWHYSEAALVPSVRPVMQIVYQPSSDGSYYGETLGVDRPTLVSGAWQTEHFCRYSENVQPDA
jgi:hypothetical protein